MKLHLDRLDDDVRIEIVPLIDVIFCILTFFILAAVTFTRQQAIEVDLPQASTARPQMRQLAIVTLTPSRQLYVDRDPVSQQELVARIQGFVQATPDGRVALYGSEAAFYSDVLEVLDLLREVAGDRVVLATRPPGDRRLGDAENLDPFGDFSPFSPNGDRPDAPSDGPASPNGQSNDPLSPSGNDLAPFPGDGQPPGLPGRSNDDAVPPPAPPMP